MPAADLVRPSLFPATVVVGKHSRISHVQVLELFGWVAFALAACAQPQLRPVYGACAGFRILTLGVEGAIAFLFAGHMVLELVAGYFGIDLPLVVISSSACTVRILVSRSRALRTGTVLFFSITPFLVLAYLHNQGLPDALRNRLAMMVCQSFAAALVVAWLRLHQLDLRRFACAALICGSAALPMHFLEGAQAFTRILAGAPLETGRAGGFGFVALAVTSMMDRDRMARYVYAFLALFCAYVSVIALTRQGLWAACLALAVLLLFSRRMRRSAVLAVGRYVVVFAAVISSIILYLGFSPGEIEAPDLQRVGEIADTGRVAQAALAYDMFLDKPFMGHGFGGFGIMTGDVRGYSHNVVTEVMCEFGLLGLILCGIPSIIMLSYGIPPSRLQGSDHTIIAAIFTYAIAVSMASYTLSHSIPCFFFLAWLLTAFCRRQSCE